MHLLLRFYNYISEDGRFIARYTAASLLGLKARQSGCLESTVSPRCTEDVRPILEETGLKAGRISS